MRLINGMYSVGGRKQHPLRSQLCQFRAVQKINEFAVVFEAEFGCVSFFFFCMFIEKPKHRLTEMTRQWHVIWGVQSVFRLAEGSNAAQTSVSKVTELMRPLQTNPFCVLISQLKACQTVELTDAKCYQSEDQTHIDALCWSVFTFNPGILRTSNITKPYSQSLSFATWCPLISPLLRWKTVISTVIMYVNVEIICLFMHDALIIFPFI